MNLTSLQKQAVTKVLMDIMGSDGRLTVGEATYFDKLQREIGISNPEIEQATKMSVAYSLMILKELNPDDKQILAFIMAEMIKADSNVSEHEIEIFSVVCAAVDIPLPN